MNYPTRLLPKSNYKKIKCTDHLFPLFLIHYTRTKNLFIKETHEINPDEIILQSDHLRDLSTNLLGEFLIEDNKIEITEKVKRDFFNECWNEGDEARIPKYGDDFCINEDRGCCFWKIGTIISLQFSHKNNIDNSVYELIFNVSHTPIKCNFWHFSIKVFDNKNNEISTLDIGTGLKRQLWKKAKEQLVKYALIETPIFNKLDSKYYKE